MTIPLWLQVLTVYLTIGSLGLYVGNWWLQRDGDDRFALDEAICVVVLWPVIIFLVLRDWIKEQRQ
jgi:hypothetical protein